MTDLQTVHRQHGATLAADGIPLHYGQQAAEYDAALQQAILLDRSHEGRLIMAGRDALTLINRISTNQTLKLAAGEGCATLFTTSTARIIERAEVIQRADDTLLLTQPPRRALLHDHLRSNIFFNDQATLADETDTTHAFALHGYRAADFIARLVPAAAQWPLYHSEIVSIDDIQTRLIRRQTLVGSHWLFVVARAEGVALYQALLAQGAVDGLIPAGSLTYNLLRIRAGVPSLPEMNEDYLPLEAGLWDEVNFHKGCYTGQEIIARMDSREKLARVMVRLQLSAWVAAPTVLTVNGQKVGQLTSSVTAPNGDLFAIGFVRTTYANPNQMLIADTTDVSVLEMLGSQPAWVQPT